MRRFSSCILLISWLYFSGIACAECSGVCAQYCGKGYCTDYIAFRLNGARQSGDAKNWFGNVCSGDAQVGDVAIFGPTNNNSFGHVAVVESVSENDIIFCY